MAGALTYKGEHHAFQGCPASLGWSHSASKDLVHWEDRGRGVHSEYTCPLCRPLGRCFLSDRDAIRVYFLAVLHETYEGMDSTSCGPCSGFVAVDDEGAPCAGFRQVRSLGNSRSFAGDLLVISSGLLG